jgi:glycine/D-amino acid oxidase-like deaminating enzyme
VNTAVEVLVVGLGAMGSAATYQLAKRGVNVIGIERQKHSPHEEHGCRAFFIQTRGYQARKTSGLTADCRCFPKRSSGLPP